MDQENVTIIIVISPNSSLYRVGKGILLQVVCHVKIKIMELDKFYTTLGRITFNFSKIDFLISNMAVELELVDSYPEFFFDS